MNRAHFTPRPGILIRDPAHGFLAIPEGGLVLNVSSYLLRRVQDGDLVMSDPPAEITTEPPVAAETKE